MNSILKKPSAWLPIAMSLTILFTLFGHIAIYGIVHETDEGTAAHIFQILLVLQIPIIIYFAAKWVPRNPKLALKILILQFIAILIPIALVYFLEY